MPVNQQTDTSLVNNFAATQNAFNNAYTTTVANMDAIRKGRESATVNKLMSEAVDPATGTFDKNKLIGGLASVGLGSEIPTQLANIQSNEINNLKVAGAKIEASQQQLGLIGQLFGGITTKVEYDNAKARAQELGIDVSRYPDATDDASAASFGKTASSNAVSASDKLDFEYKNSELYTRMEKYKQQDALAQSKLTQDEAQFNQDQQTKQENQQALREDRQANREDRQTARQEALEAKKEAAANKPMPVGYAKQYQELLDKEAAHNSNIARANDLLIDPALENVNLVTGKVAGVQNWLGADSETSRYVAKLQSGIKEIVNEDLRLNKGAQTDKDYVNSKDALLSATNQNNPALIKQALGNYMAQQKRLMSTTLAGKKVIESQFPTQTTGESASGSKGRTHSTLGTISPDEEDL